MTWTVEDSARLYGVDSWGAGFFRVAPKGALEVLPRGAGGPAVDLHELTCDLVERGVRPPITIRFSDILAARVALLADCFERAIAAAGYRGRYAGVYPIKVNQQRHVVQDLVASGAAHRLGLECGSKPELLVVLSQMRGADALVVCNGFKDREYVETALLASKLGLEVVLVIDRRDELPLVIEVADGYGIRPRIGFRAKLHTQGSGMWVESAGARSKFGLSAPEMVEGVEQLSAAGMLDCLELLHFHIGSQIPTIQHIKGALREGARLYTELVALGAGLRYMDVGGGLGVDYDGSRSTLSSADYDELEYASDVVATLMSVCDERGVAHPDIVTECGRALTAHHSVLVFDLLGRNRFRDERAPEPPRDGDHALLARIETIRAGLAAGRLTQSHHNLVELRSDLPTLFTYGVLSLEQRARAERGYWQLLTMLERQAREAAAAGDEDAQGIAVALETELADVLFANFSVFQSLPDTWALGQTFPCLPIQRLDEQPSCHATIGDLTCDSDGKLERFIDTGTRETRRTLAVHETLDGPYYLGAFLTGAYQEILGDLHNLFGDNDTVIVSLRGDRCTIDHLVRGDTIGDVLGYLEYPREEMLENLRLSTEDAIGAGRISRREARELLGHFEHGLSGYTYLEPSAV